MQGRVYDPTIGRFLQADLVVQAPGQILSYNRYGYGWNNPKGYTDPSGYFCGCRADNGDIGASPVDDGTKDSTPNPARAKGDSNSNEGDANLNKEMGQEASDNGVVISPDAQEDEHFDRNQNQPDPWARVEDVPKKWFKNWGETGTHNIGTSGNQDWRGTKPNSCLDSRCRSKEINPYRGWQLIYDKNGDLVSEPVNGGTFDYGRPSTIDHINRDVTPWVERGNGPLDTTTREQRVNSLPGAIQWLYD